MGWRGGEREDVGQRLPVGRGIARQKHAVHDRLARRRRDDDVGRALPAVRHLNRALSARQMLRLACAASRSACSEAASSS